MGFYVIFLIFWGAYCFTHSPPCQSTDYYTTKGFRRNEKQLLTILAATIACLPCKYFPLKLLLQDIECAFNFIFISSLTVFMHTVLVVLQPTSLFYSLHSQVPLLSNIPV